MTLARFLIGDTRDVTATLPDASVDLVLTSPPFLALRSYLPPDHPDKDREIGSEATPAEFIDVLLELTAEWGRILAPHGSIAIELGDSYSDSGGAGGDYNRGGLRDGQQQFAGPTRAARAAKAKDAWPLPKSKAMIPELYRVALAYGINPLTGEVSPAGRWRVRNVVTWGRPNPPVGALGDKYRPATSDMVIACRASDRWFDIDAARGPQTEPRLTRVGEASASRGVPGGDSGNPDKLRMTANPAGAPPSDYLELVEALLAASPVKLTHRQRARWVRERLDEILGPSDLWTIPPGGYAGAHFAVYPPELCILPVETMCPREVCTVCGQPRRRMTVTTNAVGSRPPVSARSGRFGMDTDAVGVRADLNGAPDRAIRETVGWSDCGHDSWRRGIVFDPFGGSGTTGVVATGHGRDAILVDLDARNADLASDRIGPLLVQIEDMRTPEQIAAGVLDDPTGPADVLALELDLDEPDPVAESGVVIDLDARRSAGVSS